MITATQEQSYLKGNELIHVFMGWEYMTPKEIVDYTVSPMRIGRDNIVPEEFVKRISHLPNMKKKGAVITTLSHDDIFYSDHLHYERSIDSLIPVMEQIRDRWLKDGIEDSDDLMYTMQYLLNGGYKFGSLQELPKLNFSVENIWSRIVMMLKYYNIK